MEAGKESLYATRFRAGGLNLRREQGRGEERDLISAKFLPRPPWRRGSQFRLQGRTVFYWLMYLGAFGMTTVPCNGKIKFATISQWGLCSVSCTVFALDWARTVSCWHRIGPLCTIHCLNFSVLTNTKKLLSSYFFSPLTLFVHYVYLSFCTSL